MRKLAMTSLVMILLLSGCGMKEKSSKQVTDNSKQPNAKLKSNDHVDSKESDPSKKPDKSALAQNIEKKQTTSKTLNGAVPVVAKPTAINVMVNKSNALPKGYRPKDLVRPKVKFVFGNQKLDKALMRSEAASALEKMFKAASSQGIDLYAASGFRSYERQDDLFQQEIKQVGRAKAEIAVAKPGTSEHQTGLTMDITASSAKYTLTESFENKKEGKWLVQHAHEYGFILRYPKGKENITKYKFEPWHFRYVGTKIATEVYNKGITLEEYFGKVKGV